MARRADELRDTHPRTEKEFFFLSDHDWEGTERYSLSRAGGPGKGGARLLIYRLLAQGEESWHCQKGGGGLKRKGYLLIDLRFGLVPWKGNLIHGI